RTSHSVAIVAVRGGRAIERASCARVSGGTSRLRLVSRAAMSPGAALGQQPHRDRVGPPGALLETGQRLVETGLEGSTGVPRPVDVGDELAGIDVLEWGHVDLEIFEEATDLARVRERDERDPLERGEDQEVQAHPHGEVEVADEREELSGRVLALQHHGPV